MIQAQESPCSFIGRLARLLHVDAELYFGVRRPIQGFRRMPSQAWHLARLGSILGTLVPFTSFCYQSTFFLSSSGGGLPGRLATLNRVETPVLFLAHSASGT